MLATVAFDNGRIPAILGRVTIPQWNIDGVVRFLIDTGSNGVLLGPMDVKNLRIPYDRLAYTAGLQGIGQHPTKMYSVNAALLFSETNYDYIYDLTIDISDPREASPRNPSILGRVILHRWRMIYDNPNNILDIDPIEYDRRLP
jgi:hypothetical protein